MNEQYPAVARERNRQGPAASGNGPRGLAVNLLAIVVVRSCHSSGRLYGPAILRHLTLDRLSGWTN